MPGREGQDWIIAPRRVVDDDLARVVYGPGDRVPMDDALRYGLVDSDPRKKPAKKATKKGKRAKKGPAEDRARKPFEDR